MTRVLLSALLVAAFVSAARANELPPEAAAHVGAARTAYARGDYQHARDELLAAYQIAQDPSILFALGQAEFNLGHYKEAIDYYTRFNATNPPADQAALAEQAIGAARVKLATPPETHVPPKPPPPHPPPHREWRRFDTALAITGGVCIVGGGALIGTSVYMAGDHSGTLHSYDRRVQNASLERSIGIGAAAAGAIALTAAVLRWRFDLVESPVAVDAGADHVSIAWRRAL